MADIELVIKIDEKLYNYMQTEEYDKHLDKRFDYQIRFAVKDGVPLPKSHGRLIDVDEVIKIANKKKDLHGAIWNAPTIIEADRSEEE